MSEKVWYFENTKGAQEGPCTLEELSALFEKNEITAATRIWVDPTDKKPYSDIEQLAAHNIDYPSPVPRERQAQLESPSSSESIEKPHPWRRFWARILDYLIYGFVLGTLFAVMGIHIQAVYVGIVAIALIFLWAFIEAGFLCTWGTTPGKAILGLSVRKKDGLKLSYLDGISRSFSVWWLGLAAAIYPLSVITMIVACTKLSNLGETTWDRKGGYTVRAVPLSVVRIILVVLLYLILLGLAHSGQAH